MYYKIKMKSEDFFKIHSKIKSYNMEIENNYVVFEIDNVNFKLLKDLGYKYELIDSIYNKSKNFFNRYYMLMIGTLFVMAILYIDSYRVSNIEFNNETPINDEIKEIIDNKLRKLTVYDYSSIDYKELSNELRQAYSSYPYINVYKDNDVIKVDIYNYNEKVNEESYYTNIGDIIAKKDAIIDQFYIYNGSLNVYKNKYVKEGEILIDSSIGNDIYVSAKGLVFGYTYEKAIITVRKEENTFILTNNKDNYIQISLLSYIFNINKDEEYYFSNKLVEEKFNLFGIFSLKEIVEKEKNAIIRTYTKEEAINHANTLIDSNFENNKTNNLEKIVDRYVYSILENDISYDIEIILKKYESIGIFKER